MKKDDEKKLLIGGLVLGAVVGTLAIVGRSFYKGCDEKKESDDIDDGADEEEEQEDGDEDDESASNCGLDASCSPKDEIKKCSHCGHSLKFSHPLQLV